MTYQEIWKAGMKICKHTRNRLVTALLTGPTRRFKLYDALMFAEAPAGGPVAGKLETKFTAGEGDRRWQNAIDRRHVSRHNGHTHCTLQHNGTGASARAPALPVEGVLQLMRMRRDKE